MRLIDADALLTERKKSKYYHLPNGDIAIPIIDVEHAPTVKPKPQWIPCSERLPETYGAYLVQDVCGTIFVDYWRGYWLAKTTMVAWRELPEPYKGGETE